MFVSPCAKKNVIMDFIYRICLTFYVFITSLFTTAYGGCQCNQMLHPGVFSGERMTFAVEGNHNRQKRSDDGRKQSFQMGAISFEPPYLDFGEQPIGMPYIRDVMVFNPSNEKNLLLQTLSGDNAHFHASFSKSKSLSPLSNTTFEVIFLARNFGNVENTLFIHTPSGAYPYQVHGFGVQNPYRLRPFLGTRIALDHAFSSVINMYNPHDSMLQVTEVYSSGGDLHLELPSGEDDASHKHWQISPYETKAIIKLSFLGRVASNHTSFIRIRTNKFFAPNQFLILPVEVEVSAEPGIFASVDQLDFGTLRRMDEPKTIVVSLMNTGNKPVSLTDVTVDPPNKALAIDVKISVIKHSHKYIKAFAVTYSASNVKSVKQHFGKIVVTSTSKNNPVLEITYQVNVLQGTLAYSVSKTRFFIGTPPYEPVVRDIIITNTFTFPLVIHRVIVAADAHESLSVVNFSSSLIVQEQKTVTPFSIRFLANKHMSTFFSSIRVYTNASIFTIPVHCYDGLLQFRLAESLIDFGTLAVTQKHHRIFEVANPNPVEVSIKQVAFNTSLARLTRIVVNREGENQLLPSAQDGFVVKPGQVVKFRLDVTVPRQAGNFTGNITFHTQYEVKAIAFSFEGASGRIEVYPVKIVFNYSFPGQIQKTPLFLKSTFLNPVNVMSAMVKTKDKPFSFVSIKKSNAQLAPHKRQKIGDVVFDPRVLCRPECYLGIGSKRSKDKTWFSSLSLPSDTARIDSSILEIFQTNWNMILEQTKNSFISSVLIDTEAVKGVKATIEGGLMWPSLTSDRPVRFPLTHVGNVSRKTLTLVNPADVPVVVQVVPLAVYPDAQSAIDILSDRFDVDLLTAKPSYHAWFSLPTARTNSRLLNKPSTDVSSIVEAKFGVKTSPDVLSLIIAPRTKARIPVQFRPENEDQRTSVIFIRNNLTVLDIVTVQGQGARGELIINGKRPSVESVLLFELKQRHLADCTRRNYGSGGKPYRPLTVKKTVFATNPGQLATQVTSFSIDGYECEGYGFRVLNCQPMNLKPTASAKIDIAFSPDFSVSRVSRRLQIKTALGTVFEFSLIATIPAELIPLCAAAAGRPVWEFHVYVSAIAVMICLLMVVFVVAHFEANKLITASLGSLSTSTALLNGSHMNGEIFDLRKISAQSQAFSISKNPYQLAHESNSSSNTRTTRKEVVVVEKTKANTCSQNRRRNSSDSYDRIRTNNNSINTEVSESERSRDKVKSNDSSNRETGKKQRKGNNALQTTKKKEPASSISSSPEVMTDEVFYPEVLDTGTISQRLSRDNSLSDANSVNSDSVQAVPAKKEKSKLRKKTAKVSPTPSEDKKSKVTDKEKVKDLGKEKEKEKDTKGKGNENNKSNSSDKSKEKRNKHNVEMKDDNKESKKHETSTKTLKSQNGKNVKSRRTSLPVDLENLSHKTKEDKPKLHQTSSANIGGKHLGHSGKSLNAGSNKKSPAIHAKSLPGSMRASKQTNDHGESSGDNTPHTITEAINSALERTLKNSPTGEPGNQVRSSQNHSRCSSVSPSPPLSDSSQNLSQSSRSSSYSSVVGSEESASGGSEHSSKRKKHNVKTPKPSPLVFQKRVDVTKPFHTKALVNNGACNGLTSNPWQGLWDSSASERKGVPTKESFTSVSTSSSLFASTPFDKDDSLEDDKPVQAALVSDECQSSGDKYPLYTFHDVKAPGLSTPFVDVDTSVPRFWSDQPISSLESLIPNLRQKKSTNWVNFLDESSSGTPNLSSPGMPQGTKTVAEIWDAGHLGDENDGWSTAFSPTIDSELSPQFPSFHQPYESAWSTGAYQDNYYGIQSDNTWGGGNCGPEPEYSYVGRENDQYTSSSHQLNPYSQPWDGSGLANNRWASGP